LALTGRLDGAAALAGRVEEDHERAADALRGVAATLAPDSAGRAP
jgi:hypothetical protein